MEHKNLWIIANWKSNKTISEALEWVDQVGPEVPKRENLKVVVCPTFVCLEEVKKAILVGGYPIIVGSQDLSPYGEGAYTGEQAARILKDIVEIAILGHSERRENFGETDEMVAEKTVQADEYQIKPLVCVQDEKTPVSDKVELIAYEPIFAIGTGTPDTPDNANTVAESLKKKYGEEREVLYGGSITPENAKAFLQQDNISGLLIGKSSLEPNEFLQIIDIAKNLS